MSRTGITHQEFDLDGASCLRFLEKRKEIDVTVFVENEEKIKKNKKQTEKEKIICVDISPSESLLEVEVYDHHQTEEKIAAFDILVKEKGLKGFDREKLFEWQKLVRAADHEECRDSMDIHDFFERIHALIPNPKKAYEEWFIPLFDSFFEGDEDISRGKKLFKEGILKLLRENPDSPVGDFIEKLNWLERLEKPEREIKAWKFYFRNIVRFVSYMKPGLAKNWLTLSLYALDNYQKKFIKDLEMIKSSTVEIFGKSLIVSKVTSSRTFVKAAGYYISHPEEFEVPLQVKEKIPNRGKTWFLVKVSPQERNFQIFPRGENNKVIAILCEEIVKALRAEILMRKGKKVPSWSELSKGEALAGTEPLFFNKKTKPQILWGSLKYKVIPAEIFGKTAYEIKENIDEMVIYAIDEYYFPPECDLDKCRVCPIYPWQLRKCHKKRSLRKRVYAKH